MAVSNEIHLITVHGTWGRGFWRNRTVADLAKRRKPPWCFPGSELPWFCAGSKFLKTLQSELLSRGLTSTVEAFEWSGANSIVDRQKGGDDLAEMLKPLEKSRVVLLAHSHGGSVALAALHRSDGPAVEAVAMATPFIKLQDQTDVQDTSHLLEKWLAFLAFVGAPIFLFYVVHRARLSMGVDVPDVIEYVIFLALPALAIAACFRSARVMPGRVYERMKSSLDSRSDELPPRHRLLVLRGFDDEAAHVIALGGITSFATRTFTAGLVGLMVVGILFVGGGIGFLANVSGSSALNRISVFLLELWPVGLIMLICVALPYRLARAVFGKEFLWLGSDVATTVNSCPDNSGNVITITLRNSDRKRLRDLNHGLYDHNDAATEVAKWISPSH
jgi:pimeloyl-ACP methyl ester carboxylesterase